MNNKFKSKEVIEKELAWFQDWAGESATGSVFEQSNRSISQGKEAISHSMDKQKSDQESMGLILLLLSLPWIMAKNKNIMVSTYHS